MNTERFTQIFGADYISSRSNPKTVLYAKLSDRKYRNKEKLFLAEGCKLAEEALLHVPESVWCVLFSASAVERTEEGERIFSVAQTAKKLSIPVSLFADSAFEKISTESAPQGVIAVVSYPDKLYVRDGFENWQQGRRLIMLEEIRDPGNLGTILRTAEAMGVEGVILSGCADLYSNKVARAAMGSLFRVPVFVTTAGEDCVEALRKAGRRVFGAALGEHTLTLGQYEIRRDDCLIIGNEGHGISESVLKKCTACVRIPMQGSTESLNASAAAACLLWEYARNL